MRDVAQDKMGLPGTPGWFMALTQLPYCPCGMWHDASVGGLSHSQSQMSDKSRNIKHCIDTVTVCPTGYHSDEHLNHSYTANNPVTSKHLHAPIVDFI